MTFLLKIAVETLKTARAVRVEVLLINIYPNMLGSWLTWSPL